jgi:predicted RNA-binding Zn-ribbon protein involved in translation (DUF1610 family)
MPYLLLILVVAAVAVFAGLSSAASQTAPAKTTSAVESSQSRTTARSNIGQRLETLARSDAPTQLSMGAMCYRMAAAPVTADYVCPACGEKTIYSRRAAGETAREYSNTRFIETEIPACRRLMKSIQDLKTEGLTFKLDESQFCAKCSPDLEGTPKLVLVVSYEGEEKAHRIEGVTADDLGLLHEFLSGADTHKGEQGAETPLKDHLERLEELLGVEVAAAEGNDSDND